MYCMEEVAVNKYIAVVAKRKMEAKLDKLGCDQKVHLKSPEVFSRSAWLFFDIVRQISVLEHLLARQHMAFVDLAVAAAESAVLEVPWEEPLV